jgi:hypothetical protein
MKAEQHPSPRRFAYSLGIFVSVVLNGVATFVLVAAASSLQRPDEARLPALRLIVAAVAVALALAAIATAIASKKAQPQRWMQLSALWSLTAFFLVIEWIVVLATGRT